MFVIYVVTLTLSLTGMDRHEYTAPSMEDCQTLVELLNEEPPKTDTEASTSWCEKRYEL